MTYKSNPPTSGQHNPEWAHDGDYVGVTVPPIEKLVHPLEHGRIEYQYAAGLPKKDIDQLETLFNEKTKSYGPGAFLLLFQNPTNMPYQVAATAWDHSVVCKTFNPGVFDAFRAFREKFTLKAPETQFTGPE